MCLYLVTERFDPPDQTEREAWKIFYKDHAWSKSLHFEFGQYKGSEVVPVGEWLDADNGGSRTGCGGDPLMSPIGGPYCSGQVYKPGFHVFIDESAAKSYCSYEPRAYVVTVKVRGIHTVGNKGGKHGTIAVAQEMFVPFSE
jgi:hypothetical protein